MGSIEMWDAEAAAFDEAADHGLNDPDVRAAWRDLLMGLLPAAPAAVADLGCGTGTLSLLLAEEGYAVTGLDFSPEMLARARVKVPTARFVEGDAAEPALADPALAEAAYDVVLCRHVLWALPEPTEVLRRWTRLLRPGGRLVLVEGRWGNGAGLTAEQTLDLLRAAGREGDLTRLPDARYWGREISDERYVVVSRR